MIKISPITHHPAVAVSWCSADASAGSSSVSPGTQIWVFIQLPISMKLVQTELGSMSQAARKGTGWAQHPISSVSTARLGQQQQSALKKAIQNPNVLGRTTNVGCLLLLYCYLVASCRQKRQGFLKKRVFGSSASSAQCAANLLRGEWVPSATCLSLRLILKCLFQDPLTKVQVEKNPRELCLCVLHFMSKAKFLLQTTFAKSVYQVIAEQKDFGWFKILVIRYSGTLFYMEKLPDVRISLH